VEEVSKRTAGGLNAIVAYDASAPDTGVSWPLVWYLRDYTAQRSFDKPTRSLREAVAVIVDQKNFDQIEGALGNEFYRFDYIRMWWPNQDYFNLDRSRILNAITNPQIREGIFDIWFNRDEFIGMVSLDGVKTISKDLWGFKQVRDIMTPLEFVPCLKPTDDASEALSRMVSGDIGQMPVVEDGHLKGIVSRRDIMSFFKIKSDLGAA